jgi:signal transduction histidine kinase
MADAEQLKRVINNIIGNSVKYLDKKKGIIQIRILDGDEYVQIEIEDNGAGILNEDIPHIFDRFYRADASRNSKKGGSGLGLAISKKIIEDHSGRIWAESRPGQGTTVIFTLRKVGDN